MLAHAYYLIQIYISKSIYLWGIGIYETQLAGY